MPASARLAAARQIGRAGLHIAPPTFLIWVTSAVWCGRWPFPLWLQIETALFGLLILGLLPFMAIEVWQYCLECVDWWREFLSDFPPVWGNPRLPAAIIGALLALILAILSSPAFLRGVGKAAAMWRGSSR